MPTASPPAKKTVSEKQPVIPQETCALARRGISIAELPTLLLKTRIKSETEKAKLLEIKAKVEGGKYIDCLSTELTASQDRLTSIKFSTTRSSAFWMMQPNLF